MARYLSTPEPPPLPSIPNIADNGCKTRLLRHLDNCIAEIETEICPILPPNENDQSSSTSEPIEIKSSKSKVEKSG